MYRYFFVSFLLVLIVGCGSSSDSSEETLGNSNLKATYPFKNINLDVPNIIFSLKSNWEEQKTSFVDSNIEQVESSNRLSHQTAKNTSIYKQSLKVDSSLKATKVFSQGVQKQINSLKQVEFKFSNTPIEFKGSSSKGLNELIENDSTIVISNDIDIDEEIVINKKKNVKIVCTNSSTLIGRNNYEDKPLWQPKNLNGSSVNSVVSAVSIKNSKYIQFEGCEFRNTQAILISKSQYINIKNIKVNQSNGYGVVVENGNSNVVIDGSSFSENYGSGVLILSGNRKIFISNNSVKDGKGASSWHAGIVITDKQPVRSVGKTDFLFANNHLYPNKLSFDVDSATKDVFIIGNTVENSASQGIMVDGAYKVFIGQNNIKNNNRAGILSKNSIALVVSNNDVFGNGLLAKTTGSMLSSEYSIPYGTDADGNFNVKEASVILDNAIHNILINNRINNNYGTGILLKRAAFYNMVGENKIVDNNIVDRGDPNILNDGVIFNDAIDINGMALERKGDSVDFAPSMGNVIYKNEMLGKHESGIRLCIYCEDNEIFDNRIKNSKKWSISQYLPRQKNLFSNNESSINSENANISNNSSAQVIYNDWTKRFKGEVDNFNTITEADNMFIGSSTIRLWNLGAAFPGYNVVNKGFGGAEAFETKSFMKLFLKDVKPKNIFIYVGENDVAASRNLMRTIYHIQENIMYAKLYSPDSKIFYISIKPSPSRIKFEKNFQYVNRHIEKFVKENDGTYIDIRDIYFKEDGSINEKLYQTDLLHFNNEGYEKLNLTIKKYIS